MLILTILGLALFEIVSSIDNAVINAEVLETMQPRGRKWFLTWGFLFAVVLVRGILPWAIVWATAPSLGPLGALSAAFSGDPATRQAIESAAPLLLQGGGIFLVLLFLHWLFLEEKHFGLPTEKYFQQRGEWFYVYVTVLLLIFAVLGISVNPALVLSALAGFVLFSVLQAVKKKAEQSEEALAQSRQSDLHKLLYLELIDAVFSVDGVLGAFAFTLSVPLILLGNGLGAFVVREFTRHNASAIKKYFYLKNGAMYAILCLGAIMLLDSFSLAVPEYLSPLVTFGLVSYFFLKSRQALA